MIGTVNWLKIMVVNRGREITPEHLDRIFEKFYRGDDARTTASGGAGLGLAIAREIARAHGGDITAASENGMTSFAIWIPQAGF
ncbi:ATP-binding protein [Raoultibacter massiliensis]|uniref:ATP-binding protein n=1 Tax=Raoultibacter massiliensis TaxID=1852371 RepID=UPI001FEB92C8|nr:ATP-binding protein [Raoultibacter massiliensis]